MIGLTLYLWLITFGPGVTVGSGVVVGADAGGSPPPLPPLDAVELCEDLAFDTGQDPEHYPPGFVVGDGVACFALDEPRPSDLEVTP